MNRYLENLVADMRRTVDILDGVYPADSPEGRLVADMDAALEQWTETGPAARRATSPVAAGPIPAARKHK